MHSVSVVTATWLACLQLPAQAKVGKRTSLGCCSVAPWERVHKWSGALFVRPWSGAETVLRWMLEMGSRADGRTSEPEIGHGKHGLSLVSS